jgi:hypothetical protein
MIKLCSTAVSDTEPVPKKSKRGKECKRYNIPFTLLTCTNTFNPDHLGSSSLVRGEGGTFSSTLKVKRDNSRILGGEQMMLIYKCRL